jgi:uncharacterized protein YciI
MHYLLFYDVVDGYAEKRAPFRQQHLEKIRQAHERGELVMAGALADPVDGAVLVFREPGKAEEFAESDPYVLHRLVRAWRVRLWTTVAGDGISLAEEPRVTGRPEQSEYPPYASIYVNLVSGDAVLQTLASQLESTAALLRSVDEGHASEYCYAPGKWTIKQVIGHVLDTERIFAYRALRIARGDTTPLPGFEQDDYVRAANFNACPLPVLLEDFRVVRQSTLGLFRSLPEQAWLCRGVANQHAVTVRGLAFMLAGHERHHVNILRERYLKESRQP